jgi:hypothetical protein
MMGATLEPVRAQRADFVEKLVEPKFAPIIWNVVLARGSSAIIVCEKAIS